MNFHARMNQTPLPIVLILPQSTINTSSVLETKSSNNLTTQIIRNHHPFHFRVFVQIGVFESEVAAEFLGSSKALQ
jgi:hypothetical protein